LEYAAPALRADREFVLGVIKKYGCRNAMLHVAAELKADRDFILTAVDGTGDPEIMQFASQELRADRFFVLKTVAKHGRQSLRFASAGLQDEFGFEAADEQMQPMGAAVTVSMASPEASDSEPVGSEPFKKFGGTRPSVHFQAEFEAMGVTVAMHSPGASSPEASPEASDVEGDEKIEQVYLELDAKEDDRHSHNGSTQLGETSASIAATPTWTGLNGKGTGKRRDRGEGSGKGGSPRRASRTALPWSDADWSSWNTGWNAPALSGSSWPGQPWAGLHFTQTDLAIQAMALGAAAALHAQGWKGKGDGKGWARGKARGRGKRSTDGFDGSASEQSPKSTASPHRGSGKRKDKAKLGSEQGATPPP